MLRLEQAHAISAPSRLTIKNHKMATTATNAYEINSTLLHNLSASHKIDSTKLVIGCVSISAKAERKIRVELTSTLSASIPARLGNTPSPFAHKEYEDP